MITEHGTRRGFTLTELIVSIIVLGALFIIFALSLDGFRRLNNYQLVRQRCVSAAQATLDSIASTGSAIDENDLQRLWPGISIKIDESQGSGQWTGLKVITVTAEAASFNKKAEVRLSRYFLKKNGDRHVASPDKSWSAAEPVPIFSAALQER
jgi:prepilin-type N-terminal cleavage/methylation domain-containing protein